MLEKKKGSGKKYLYKIDKAVLDKGAKTAASNLPPSRIILTAQREQQALIVSLLTWNRPRSPRPPTLSQHHNKFNRSKVISFHQSTLRFRALSLSPRAHPIRVSFSFSTRSIAIRKCTSYISIHIRDPSSCTHNTIGIHFGSSARRALEESIIRTAYIARLLYSFSLYFPPRCFLHHWSLIIDGSRAR